MEGSSLSDGRPAMNVLAELYSRDQCFIEYTKSVILLEFIEMHSFAIRDLELIYQYFLLMTYCNSE